jgi:tetratricopeptide (TPR) repeat protein
MINEDIARPGDSQEGADAQHVNSAMRALHAGDLATAEALLTEVAERIPREYIFQFEKDGTLFAKFWDNDDFLNYVLWQKRQGISKSVTWIGSAYPRACYYLGFLNVKCGKFDRAIEWLDRGMGLEPTNPKLRFEKAQALIGLKRHEEALALYQSVTEPGPHVSPRDVALALRGRGFVLIEMGSLDLAESSFQKSLEVDPGNEIARKELNYISHLRRGGKAGATGRVAIKASDINQCAICGQKSAEGRLLDVRGKPVFVCKKCARKATKRWWQFWK